MTNIFSAPLKLMFLLGSLLPIHSSKSIYTGSDPTVAVSLVSGTSDHRPQASLPNAPARSGVETPPADGPKTSRAAQRNTAENPARLSPDPIRFSIQCDKRQIAIDEEVNLTITAQLLNVTPNQLFFAAGSGAYTLKLILPPGFEQTGGDVIDYVAGNLSATSQSVMTYRVRGRFRSVTPGTSFRLLRSHGQANDQSIFAEKSVVTLQGLSIEQDGSQLRKMATGPANPDDATLYVVTDKNATGAARAAAATAADYRGYLDYAACDAVSGWIVNRSELRKSQEVDIYINGAKAATVLADQARRDVASSFGVNDFSAYGYVWVIPDYYKANVVLTLSVRPAQTGSDLTNSPRRTSVCPGNGTPPTSGTTTVPGTTTTTPPVTTTTTPPATGGALTMLAPTYNCATGAITFNTSGGNGTPIRFRSTGITDWTTNPNQYLDAGSRVNADTPPFTIYFEQSGRIATYTWSRQATCTGSPPPTTTPPVTPPPVTPPPVTPPPVTTPPVGTLTMLAPTYNCATGAITFNTSGGDGTPIRFRATGITGWTTNPNQYLDAGSRVNADTPPFTIYFEQSGRVFTYTWSRQDTCAGSNPSTPPPTTTPPVTPPPVTPPPTTPGACAASISRINYNWDGGNSSISIVLNASAGSPQIKLSGPTSIDWSNTFDLGNSTWFWANQNMGSGSYTLSVRQAGDGGAGCSFSFSVPGTGRQLYPAADGGTPPPPPPPTPCTPPSAPTVNTPGGTQVCNNSTVTLNASGCSGTTTWSGGQTGSSINVGSAGTYTATCTVNGCVSGPSNQLTVTACAPPTSGGRYNRVLYVGNSITLHGGSPFFIVNGQNPKRGMAATSPDRDYVRLMSAKHRSLNGSVENRTLASWDMGGQLDEATGPYWEGNSTKNGIDLARFDPVANWKPDIVYIRLGENVADEEITNQSLYQSRLKALIDKLISQAPGAKVVLSTSVWGKSNYDTAIRAVGAERNYPIADFSDMWPNRLINGYYALGVYGDAGTDNHPDDDGMARMADGLWNATPK